MEIIDGWFWYLVTSKNNDLGFVGGHHCGGSYFLVGFRCFGAYLRLEEPAG
jgi:hypothetical protein